MKAKRRSQNKRNRRNAQRKPATARAASATVEPPLAWVYLLAAGAVVLLSFVAVIGGYADGSIVHIDMFYGDNWYLQELYRGIVDGYPVDGYRVGVAPVYFPETLTWLALAALLPADAVWFLCGLVVNLFGAAGWVMVCRRLGGGALSQSAVLLAYAAQYLLLAYGGNELFLLLVVHPIHNGAWQMLPWLLWACLGRRVIMTDAVLLFALLAAVAAGNMVIVSWFAMPAVLIIVLQWRRGFIDKRAAALLSATIAAAVVFGRLAHRLLGPFEESVNTGKFLALHPDQWITGIENFFLSVVHIAQFIPHLALLWVIFVVFWLRVALRLVRKSNDHAAVFVALFIPASMLTACGAMFATGLAPDPNHPGLNIGDPRISSPWKWMAGLRYIFPAVLFPLLVGWPVLMALSWERRKPPVHRYLPAALAVCMLAAVPKVWGIDYQKNVSPFHTPFAVCMRDNAKRMGWSGGIGSWFFFRNSIVDTDNPIKHALQVQNVGVFGERFAKTPLMVAWNSTNRHHFSGEFQVVAIDHYKGRRYMGPLRTAADRCRGANCFKVFPDHALNEEVVRAVFGEPAQILECEGIGLYHYDPPIRLDLSQHKRNDQFPVFLPRRDATGGRE